jgi:hypothetical protein
MKTTPNKATRRRPAQPFEVFYFVGRRSTRSLKTARRYVAEGLGTTIERVARCAAGERRTTVK